MVSDLQILVARTAKMPPSVTPSTLLLRQTDNFLELLSGVRDGDTAAIHDARVATRRMRELLPLVAEGLSPADAEQLDRILRESTQRLGRARDVDAKLEMLTGIEPGLPLSSGEVGRLRLEWQEERDRRVRRAIKSLERMDVEAACRELHRTLLQDRPSFMGLRRHASAAPRWEDTLLARLRERAGDVVEGVGRAGGVLFPKRLHGARVSVKKLRYAMEIATATGRIDFEGDLRQIRKAQELLGRIHDHDVLADGIRAARLGAQRLLPLIELERRRLHTRYLRRRAALLDISGRVAVSASRDHRALSIRRSVLAASVPLVMLALPLVRRARSA